MKAARYYGKHDLRIEETTAPPQPGHGEVLVAPTFCGICGTDLHEFESGPIFTPQKPNAYSGALLPQILGHEFAGRVVAIGPGVEAIKVNDRVSIQPQIGPRHDYYGQRNLCFLGPKASVVGLSWPWGGMGELALVKEYNCIPMPDYISDQEGALIEPAAVAVHAVDRSGLVPGGSILITGGGPIGALTVLAARAAGATRIILSEPNPNRRQKVADIAPGIVTLDPSEPDFQEKIHAHTEQGIGVDAAIECAGSPRALQSCIDAVRPQGTVVMVGLMGVPAEISPFDLIMRDITLRGSLNYPLNVWPRVFEMIHSGVFPVQKVVDAEISLDGVVTDGFKPLLDTSGTSMKILIDMQK